MTVSDNTQPKAGAADTALYIAGLAKELRDLAAKSELGFLAYLLSMVEDDANDTARRLGGRGGARNESKSDP